MIFRTPQIWMVGDSRKALCDGASVHLSIPQTRKRAAASICAEEESLGRARANRHLHWRSVSEERNLSWSAGISAPHEATIMTSIIVSPLRFIGW
jgi:hypothetical protein